MNNLPKIEEILELLSESGNRLNRALESRELHAADIDLIKQKILHTYDIVLNLTPETKTVTPIPEREKPAVSKPVTAPEPEIPSPQPVAIEEEPVLEVEVKEPSEVEKISRKIKEETAAELKMKSQQKADEKKNRFTEAIEKQSAKKSLNDQLSRNRIQTDLSKKLQTQPITDIHKAIGLNDRFLFINELFKGDNELFQQTVSIINRQTKFNEAYDYLRNTFEWDMDNPVAQQLLNIIRRKLIKSNNG